jgi:hypothetical protein
MPPHDTYIETHLGSGAVMFHKPLAARTIGIDVDENAFKLTRNRWSEMGRFRPCCIFITVMLLDFWNEKTLLSMGVCWFIPIRLICQKRAPVAPATAMNIPLPIMSVC